MDFGHPLRMLEELLVFAVVAGAAFTAALVVEIFLTLKDILLEQVSRYWANA
jgi:hypothetical protein